MRREVANVIILQQNCSRLLCLFLLSRHSVFLKFSTLAPVPLLEKNKKRRNGGNISFGKFDVGRAALATQEEEVCVYPLTRVPIQVHVPCQGRSLSLAVSNLLFFFFLLATTGFFSSLPSLRMILQSREIGLGNPLQPCHCICRPISLACSIKSSFLLFFG